MQLQKAGVCVRRPCAVRKLLVSSVDSTARLEPGDYLRPYPCVGSTPGEHAQMLQAYADFAGMLDDSDVFRWHFVEKWCNRAHRCNFVGRIDDRKRGNRHVGRPDRPVEDRQGSMTKPVLAIKPLDNLIDQLARKRDLVERPTLNARVNVHRDGIRQAESGVHPS
jgi:hypothetical protein